MSITMTLGKEWVWGSSVPWGFRVTACVFRECSQPQTDRWRLRPQGGARRGCCVAFCLSYLGLHTCLINLQLFVAAAFVAVQGTLKMGPGMGSTRTDPSTERGAGLDGQGLALGDLPTHPSLPLEAW